MYDGRPSPGPRAGSDRGRKARLCPIQGFYFFGSAVVSGKVSLLLKKVAIGFYELLVNAHKRGRQYRRPTVPPLPTRQSAS
jgi:hypothetical protein